MKKITKNSLLLFLFLIGMNFSFGQGAESFDGSNAPSNNTYADGSFVGDNNVTWAYVESRDENGDANGSGINGNALMLRRAVDNSAVVSGLVPNGIGDFSVKLYKGFTGGGNRQVELFVNGVFKGTSIAFDDFNEHIFTVTGINIAGSVTIGLRNVTSKQIIVDDITWTSFVPAPITEVSFISSTSNLTEDGLFVDVCAEITNADAVNATTVDIVLDALSTATNGTDYDDGAATPAAISFPQTLTFPAGSSADQCFTVFISNDDTVVEPDETVVLNLANVTGGNNVALGTITTHTLTIEDNDTILCTGTPTTWSSNGISGFGWSNGLPDENRPAIIDTFYNTDFSFAGGDDINACTLEITSTGILVITEGKYAKIVNDVINEGSIQIRNKGSLVQVDDNATVTGTGTYTTKILTTPLEDADRFTYIGSPVNTQNINNVFSWASEVWDFNQVTQFWNYIGDGTNTSVLAPSKGYAIRASGTSLPATMNFTGTINNGVFTQPLVLDVGTHEPTTVNGDDDATLVSNPYPSAINVIGAGGLIDQNTINEVLIWTHASQISTTTTSGWAGDDYIVCTMAGCTNAPTGGTHTGIVASGQGFFVNASATGTLTFNNSMRVTTGNDQFKSTDSDNIWLSLSNSVGYNNQILISFTNNGSENFDAKYDARNPYNTNYGMSFYALNNDNAKLAIEDRGLLNDEIIVPVGFILNDDDITDFTLSIDDIKNLEGVEIYVKDNLLNTIYDLRLSDYTFSTTGIGEFNERFEIIFTRDALSVNNEVITNDNLVVSNQNETEIKVNMLDGSIITNFKAFDILGKLIIDKSPNENNFTINTNINQGQVLFIKVTLENGQVLSNKFMKL